MTTVINLSNPEQKIQYSCTPREAVIAAYAQRNGKNGDWNTWDYEKRYGHMVVEGKLCICCGDFSAFKDGKNF